MSEQIIVEHEQMSIIPWHDFIVLEKNITQISLNLLIQMG